MNYNKEFHDVVQYDIFLISYYWFESGDFQYGASVEEIEVIDYPTNRGELDKQLAKDLVEDHWERNHKKKVVVKS